MELHDFCEELMKEKSHDKIQEKLEHILSPRNSCLKRSSEKTSERTPAKSSGKFLEEKSSHKKKPELQPKTAYMMFLKENKESYE